MVDIVSSSRQGFEVSFNLLPKSDIVEDFEDTDVYLMAEYRGVSADCSVVSMPGSPLLPLVDQA